MEKKTTTTTMAMTAVMMAMIMIMTFIIRIPIPATQGYIHLGDCMIFMAVILLGWKYGAIASAFGSALADLIGGYGFYIPITFVVKGLMAIVCGLVIEAAYKKAEAKGKQLSYAVTTIGMIAGGIVMVLGYYVAESIMYGTFIVPLAAIPMNCVQFGVGIVLAIALGTVLSRTPFKKNIAYPLGVTA